MRASLVRPLPGGSRLEVTLSFSAFREESGETHVGEPVLAFFVDGVQAAWHSLSELQKARASGSSLELQLSRQTTCRLPLQDLDEIISFAQAEVSVRLDTSPRGRLGALAEH